MKKSLLLAALEELDDQIEAGVGEDGESEITDVDSAMLAVMEAEQDYNEEVAEIDNITKSIDEVDASVERLEMLAEVISKYGISASIMEAADPYRELVMNGVCPAYEELGDIPIQNETAQGVLEGIDNIIASSVDLKIRVNEMLIAAMEADEDELEYDEDGDGEEGDEGDIELDANGEAIYAVGTPAYRAVAKAKRIAKQTGSAAASAVGAVPGKVGSKVKKVAGKLPGSVKGIPGKVKGVAGRAASAVKGFKPSAAMKVAGTAIRSINPYAAAATAAVVVLSALAAKYGPSAIRAIRSHKAALKSVSEKLKEVQGFDEAKFEGINGKVFNKANFEKCFSATSKALQYVNSENLLKAIGGLEAAINSSDVTIDKVTDAAKKGGDSIRSLSDDVKSIIGIAASIDDDGNIGSVSTKKSSIVPEKGTFGELGWKAADAQKAITEAATLTAHAEGIEKQLKSTISIANKVVDTVKKNVKKDDDVSGEEKAAYKQAIGEVRSILNANMTIVKAVVSSVYRVNGTAIRVAKGAIKAKA